ncbi:MAG: cohesin domain-containing protein [Saprospiraceae bacterium]|nr:T9SS type A sorting domain-containing protein [Lewinella sp.]
MKRIYFTLCFFWALINTSALFAQPGCLVLKAGQATAATGETICIDVSVENFYQVTGMQYSLRWDKDVLSFTEVKNFNLPGLTNTNFGTPSQTGYPDQLTFFWIDQNQMPQTLADDTPLFSICFQVTGSEGDHSPLAFDPAPTPPEFLTVEAQSAAFKLSPASLYGGSFTVGSVSPDYPAITSASCPGVQTCSEVPPPGIETNVTGGMVPYSYSWNGPDGYISNEANITDVAPGAYHLVVTDAAGLSHEALFYAPAVTSLTLTNIMVTPVEGCSQGSGGSISYNVSGGSGSYEFQWNDGATIQSRAGLSPGLYQLTVTDQLLGCSIYQAFSIESSSTIRITNVEVTDASCGNTNTGAIRIQLEGDAEGAVINWSNGAEGLHIEDLAPGGYTVSVTDATGCVTTHYEEVKASDKIEFTGTAGYEDCNGPTGFITLDVPAGLGTLTYVWSNGATTKDISGLSFGAYRVTVTNTESGCQGYGIFYIKDDEFLTGTNFECTVIDEETIFAKVSTVVWGGGTPPYTFNWSNGDSMTSDLVGSTTVSLPAVLNLTITDSKGCTTIPPTVYPDCDFNGNVSDNFSVASRYRCIEDSNPSMAEITYTIWNGGAPPYTFSWSNGLVETGDKESSIMAPADAATAYTVTVTDQLGNTHISEPILPICGISGEPLSLSVADGEAVPGEQVCLPVTVKDFFNIAGLQFTLSWDPTQLRGDSLIHFSLPNFSTSNYSFNPISAQGNGEGILTIAWTNSTGLGYTLPDDTVLFELCLTVLGDDEGAEVVISNQPTLIEATTGTLQVIPVITDDGTVFITGNDEKTVWPGDTDQNGLVDHFDLLNIGLAYGAQGFPRPEQDLSWEAHFSAPWPQKTPNTEVSFQHIDTDGNGTITANDTLALALNYRWFNEQWNGEDGYNKRENLPAAARTAAVPLYVDTYPVAEGSSGTFDIMLGDDANTNNTVYGLAFSINYDPLAIVPGSMRLSFADSWMGNNGEDLLTFYRDDPDHHMVHVAMTRIDGEDITGAGSIAKLLITIEDVIFRSNDIEIPISIEQARLINSIEEAVPVDVRSSVIVVNTTTRTLDESLDRQIRVFPVPTQNRLYLKTPNLTVKNIELFSMDGRRLREWQGQPSELFLHDLPQGTYSLRMITNEGVAVRRIIIFNGER